MSVRKLLILIITYFLQIQIGYTQTSSQLIKQDPNIIWAEATANTEDDAYVLATKRLSERINIKLNSSFELLNNNDEESFNSRIVVSSSFRFQFLKSITEKKATNEYYTIVYLDKNEYQNQLNDKKKELISTFNFIKNKDINYTLNDWLQLWSKLVFFPFDILIDIDNESISLTSLVKLRLIEYINQQAIEVSDVKWVNGFYAFKTKLTNTDLNPQHFAISIDESGAGFYPFVSNELEISWGRLPDKSEVVVDFIITYSYNLFKEPTLTGLSSTFQKKIRKKIDFSAIQPVEILTNRKHSKYIELTAKITKIELHEFNWMFPDGSITNEYTITIPKKDLSLPYQLIIQLNSVEDWETSCVITKNYSLNVSKVKKSESNSNESLLIRKKNPFIIDSLLKKMVIDIPFLEERKLLHEINFGTKNDVEDADMSWLIIVNSSTKSIIDILTPVTNQGRLSIKQDKIVLNLRETYKGNSPLYLEILK